MWIKVGTEYVNLDNFDSAKQLQHNDGKVSITLSKLGQPLVTKTEPASLEIIKFLDWRAEQALRIMRQSMMYSEVIDV